MNAYKPKWRLFWTFVLILACVAVWARRTSEDPEEKQPSYEIGTRIEVSNVFQGCSHHEESSYALDRVGDTFEGEQLEISEDQAEELYAAVMESRSESDDLLSQYDYEITAERVHRQIREYFPWVDAPLPSLDTEQLKSEARKAIVEPSVTSTSSIHTKVIFEGESALELQLSQSDLRGFSDFKGSLPSWNVRVDGESWITSSPKISEKLQPFMKDKELLGSITQWPEQYCRSLAATIGREWCEEHLRQLFGDRLSEHFLVDKLEVRRYLITDVPHGWIILKNRQESLISTLDFQFDATVDPTADIINLPSFVAESEARLDDFPWLSKAVRGKNIQLSSATGYEESWLDHGFQGLPRYEYSVQNGGRYDRTDFIVGDQEPRVLIFSPTDDLKKYLHNLPELESYKQLVVSPNGEYTQLNWFRNN